MYIVHLGISGFPTGNATIQRMRFTFKALKKAGFIPLIINKQSNQQKLPYKKKVNRFDGLIFLSTSPLLIRPDEFFKRNINKIQGILREFAFLYERRKKINSAILYTQYFSELVYYRILSKFFGFKLVIQYVEYRSSIPNRNSFFTKLNDKFYDNYCYKFCDAVIVISEFLKTETQQKDTHLPLIKIPAICDFNDFKIIPAAITDFNYFLYCGTTAYVSVINFVLAFFEKAKDEQIYSGKLMLIIGSEGLQDFKHVEKSVKNSKYEQDIILYNNLPYNNIIPFYKSADLLLIPLRNTIQDIARFPHKISEYTASGRPLISSKIGEIKHYFIDKENALLADEYDIDMYVETLRQMKMSDVSLDKIGKKGYELGYSNFHYESHIENMQKFFNDLFVPVN